MSSTLRQTPIMLIVLGLFMLRAVAQQPESKNQRHSRSELHVTRHLPHPGATLIRAQGPPIESPSIKTVEGKMHYREAIKFADKSRWRAAALELRRALRSEPENLDILVELGIALGELTKWNEALSVLRKAVEIAPDSIQAHYNLAVTLDQQNPGRNAGNPEFQRVLELDPNHVDSLINLATNMGYTNAGQAKTLLERVLKLDPKNANAYFNLGILLRSEGDEAGVAFQKAIVFGPNNMEARRRLISIYLSQRKWDEVIGQCRDALRRDPNDWFVRYALSRALKQTAHIEEATFQMRKSEKIQRIEEKGKQSDELMGRGIDELKQGMNAEAVDIFKSALELSPTSAMAHMYLGMALAASGRPQEGVGELARSLVLDPSNAKAHNNFGTILLGLGQLERARNQFERALELDPYLPEAHNNLGLMLSKLTQTKQACEHFRLAVELDPEYLEPLFNLSLALLSMNQINAAVEALKKASELAPDNPQVFDALGVALREEGDLQGGAAAMDRAASLRHRESSKPDQ
jgi:tetratricopeptide (TPR) repeat protein